MTVQLSSDGTEDYDKDALEYKWAITSENGFSKTIHESNPTLTLDQEGVYNIQLTVTDSHDNSNEQSFKIIAGNEPPEVDIQITAGNQSFFFPDNKLNYKILVNDKEDGKLAEGKIKQEEIAVNFDYTPEGFDPIEIAQNHVSSDDWVVYSKGKSLIGENDCLSCHRENTKSIGPSYFEVAKKLKGDPKGQLVSAQRIIKGSVGLWGDHAMSAHPDLSEKDAKLMLDYIMSLADAPTAPKVIPLSGTYTTDVPKKENGKGGYLLRVAYTDKGTPTLDALTTEKIIALRNPVLNPEDYDVAEGTQFLTTPGRSFNIIADNAYLGFNQLDLTDINEIVIGAEVSPQFNAVGGIIEVRLGSTEGTLVGATEKLVDLKIDFDEKFKEAKAKWLKDGKKGPEPHYWGVRNSLKPKYSVPIKNINGKQDVFFVFKNSEATIGQILMRMDNIEFKQGKAMLQ